MITFPKQREQGEDAEPCEQFSRRARVHLSAPEIKETREQVNPCGQATDTVKLRSGLIADVVTWWP